MFLISSGTGVAGPGTLKELANLQQMGALTEAEFEQQKARILNG